MARAEPQADSRRKSRCIWLLSLLVCAVGGWLSALPAAAAIIPAVDRDESGLWVAGTLILLGLIGVSGALLLKQRHRFKATREQLEAQIVSLTSRCANLETRFEAQRLDDEYRRKDLEATAERQRQAAVALRDSEYRYRNLSQQLPVGVFLVDVEGCCQYVNERWCQMSGLTAEQAIGMPWMRFVHPDEREQVLRDWRTAVEQESEFAADHRFRGPSGRVA